MRKMRNISPTNEAQVTLATHRYGTGPRRVILLHGFPDNPHTFEPILEPILNSGATVVTPYLRGYGPSSPSPKNHYHLVDLGRDVLRVMDAQKWHDAVIIGHDWGAVAAYMAGAIAPERVRGIVGMAVPPLSSFLQGLRSADQRKRSSYMAFFQLGRVAEAAVQRNDFEALETLWREWSPDWEIPQEHLQHVKATFTYPHTLRAALTYYRQLLPWGPTGWIPWLKSYRLATAPLQPPTLILHGEKDGCIGRELFQHTEGAFEGKASIHMLENAGHFLHWENPDWVANHILEFLKEHCA